MWGRWLLVSGVVVLSLWSTAVTRGQSNLPTAPFRDCAGCPMLLVMPPGSFTMGVPAGEEEHEGLADRNRGRSVPQHQVTIARPFGLGKYEVTRAEFASFVAATGHQTGDKCNALTADLGGGFSFKETAGYTWRNPGFAQTDQDPVVCVSWDDAKAYVAWLSRETAHPYRLPTEAEWEYAARAGSPRARFWGDGTAEACRYANVRDLTFMSELNKEGKPDDHFACSDSYAYTAPVGRFEANAFGLHDMLGNVFEWTEDCWNENYTGAPADGSAWSSGDCRLRVARGSSWNGSPRSLRAGFRSRGGTDYRYAGAGFRVARTF
jgi:formylglycine-generating enzyme